MDRRLPVAALTAAALLTVSTSARAQAPRPTPIHDIQGNGASSPVVGMTLTIPAVVTGVDDEIGSDFERTFHADASIFVEEEPDEFDADPSTSEGIYVPSSATGATIPRAPSCA